MKSRYYLIAPLTLAFFALAFVAMYTFGLFDLASASNIVGNDYRSTTTSSAIASSTKAWRLKEGTGSLGSVIVTMPSNATGYPSLKVYDATTTQATSTSRLITSMSTSTQTQGTYQFDAEFYYGLNIEVPVGFTGTYTITYR